MSSALTRIVTGLSLGLLMAFAVLVVSHVAARAELQAAQSGRLAATTLLKKYDPAVSSDALCRHKAPSKRHCRHASRATATAIEPSTKRKGGKPVSTGSLLPILSSARLIITLGSDALHLRLSYGAIYATTRRMHI